MLAAIHHCVPTISYGRIRESHENGTIQQHIVPTSSSKERAGQEAQEVSQSRADGSCLRHVTPAGAGSPAWLLPSSDGAGPGRLRPGPGGSGAAAVGLWSLQDAVSPVPCLFLVVSGPFSLQMVFPAGSRTSHTASLKSINVDAARPSLGSGLWLAQGPC